MAKRPEVNTVDKLIEKLANAETESSKRRAIASLSNFALEITSIKDSEAEPDVGRIVNSLIGFVEDATNSPESREVALKRIEKILRLPAGNEQPIGFGFERLVAVGRRRSDDNEVTQSARALCNRLVRPSLPGEMETNAMFDTTVSPCPLHESFNRERDAIDKLHDQIAKRVGGMLAESAGYRPTSFTEGRELASLINKVVSQYALKIAMETEEGGFETANLSFRKIGRAKPGAFVFRVGKSSKYAGVALPKLKLIREKK